MNETKRRVLDLNSITSVKKQKLNQLFSMSQELSHQSFDNEYSRLIWAIGKEALHQFQKSKVLLIGLEGLGAETSKNLVLMGVASLDIYDNNLVQIEDLSSQFFFTESDVGSRRSDVTLRKLIELNERVKISIIENDITEDVLKQYSAVCVTSCTSWSLLCKWGDYCHNNNIAFVVSDVIGLYGFIFVDFGSHFVVSDANGEEVKTAFIESITNSENSVVTAVDFKRHDLVDGDLVKFFDVKGMDEVNNEVFNVKVINPYQFSIGDTRSFKKYQVGGRIEEVKKKLELSFEPITSFSNLNFDQSKVVLFDYSKIDRIAQYYAFLRSILHYRESHENSLPKPWDEADATELVTTAKEMFNSSDIQIDESLIKQLACVSAGYLSPMAAFFGGVVAQEVLKSTSHRYTPLNQWFFLDSLECLNGELKKEDVVFRNNRYDRQVAVFGHEYMERLKNVNYFLVGAGAIGCEVLKNWAMMGLATGPNGRVCIADMDTIEISNLNRQLLYRPSDVGKLKSATAALAARAMNADMNIDSSEIKVSHETTNYYNDDFWNNLTGVCNALDNLEARLYVDSKCILHELPLLDSGTLGSKGNTQVVVPFLTESYGSSRDPPPKQTAMCLLHSFPNNIEHCLQWAREMAFETYFVDEPKIVNDYLSSNHSEYIKKLSPILKSSVLQKLKSGILERPCTFKDCIIWARNLFQELYYKKPKQLLFNFPLDTVDASGQRFWSGAKRPPVPLEYDSSNDLHLSFIVSASILKAYTCGLLESEFKPENMDELSNEIIRVASEVSFEPFLPLKDMKINVKNDGEETIDDDIQNESTVNKLLNSSQINIRSIPVQFEKDDDRNFHIDFIHAAANLRAIEYGITPVERLKSRFIAGNIVPAIVTTTAAVAGLVCLEIYKLFQKERKIEHFRNSFINLAISVFQQSEPVAPPVEKFMGKDVTLWDKINVRIGDVTIGEVLDYFRDHYHMNVDVISVGQVLVYMTFGPAKNRRNQNLKKVYESISGVSVNPSEKSFVLQIAGDDENGNSVDVMPEVIYWFS